jgi:RNA polymerase sigma-70 factor (ECF subfamily)
MSLHAIDNTLATEGGATSFERIFAEHSGLVWRALRSLGVDDSDIEDVCQEVFMTIYRRLPSFEGRSAVSTWIYGICVRAASVHRRTRRRRREDIVDELPDAPIDASQAETLADRQARALLEQMLDGLDEEKRVVFVLYELEELAMKEIADAVGCPLATAYARLYAARKQFDASLRRAQLKARVP